MLGSSDDGVDVDKITRASGTDVRKAHLRLIVGMGLTQMHWRMFTDVLQGVMEKVGG